MYKFFCDALVAELVDAADLKSVGIYPVPVQVRPSAPIKPPKTEVFLFPDETAPRKFCLYFFLKILS